MKKNLSDKEIIFQIKEGRIDYFQEIVNRYCKKIFFYFKGKVKNDFDAEDLVQNTFLKFYKSINKFDEKLPIFPYLYKIAQNELKMYLRKNLKEIDISKLNFFQISEDKEEKILFQQIFEKLKPIEKNIFSLIAEGFTYQEISQKLKKPINTIKSIIHRARNRLKSVIKAKA